MNATAAPEAPEATRTEEYISTCNELRLIMAPIRKQQIGEGTDFTFTPGSRIEFRDGRYVTSDPAEIAWLDSHASYGTLFNKVGYGAEGKTADNSAQLIADVVDLAFSGEYQKIAEILVAERGSYRRPDVISACESVLNRVNAGS